MRFFFVAVYLSVFLESGLCSVLLSGGPYCTANGDINTAVHAVPGTTISITCYVDNPDELTNLLSWSIPSFGVSLVNVNGMNGADTTQPDFQSTVDSANPTDRTTNATLTFTAVSVLDEDVLNCGDVTSATSSCTIYILTQPSPPLTVTCANSTASSVALVWSPPSDNGGETISHYKITATPDDISIITTMTSITVSDLTPLTDYTFTVRANNTLGFSTSSDNTVCTTRGEVFDPVDSNDIEVCLGNNATTGDYLLINITTPNCPPVSPNMDTTPNFDNFAIIITDFDPILVTDCQYPQPISVQKDYNITITINNQEGPSEPTTVMFFARWIREVSFDPESQKLSYSIPSCIVVNNAIITLVITNSSGSSVFEDEQPFDIANTSFDVNNNVSSNSSYNYTLLVINPSPSNTITSYTGSITSTTDSTDMTPSPSTPMTTSSDTGTGTQISTKGTGTQVSTIGTGTQVSTTGTGTQVSTTGDPSSEPSVDLVPIIAGAIGGAIILALALVVVVILIIAMIVYKKHSKGNSDKGAPIPLVQKNL